MTPDINPGVRIDSLKQQNARVREHAGRSGTTNIKEQPMNSISPMSSASLVSEGRVTITPRFADQILQTMNYSKQRRVENSHVAALAEQLRRGQFLAGTQVAFGKLPDGTLHLVNGQHRLTAVRDANVPMEFQVVVIPCIDEHALDVLYYRFDTVIRKRSSAVVRATLGFAEEWEITATLGGGIWEAIPLIAHKLKQVPGGLWEPNLKTPDGRYELAVPFKTQAKQYNDAIAGAIKTRRKRLTNGGVVAVGLLTLRDQPIKALAFWKGVADNDGLRKGDARHALVEYFASTNLMTPNVAIAVCRSAWNAWARGKALQFAKAVEGDEVTLVGVKVP